jgi:hypothetical protein
MGLFFLIIAWLMADYYQWQYASLLNLAYGLVLLWIETLLALLLARYYYNSGESPQYWRYVEDLAKLCFIALGAFFLWKTFDGKYRLGLNEVGRQLADVGLLLFLPLLILGYYIRTRKKVQVHNRWMLLLSTLAILCWQIGMHLYQLSFITDHYREGLLFAGVVLAVFAFASSFNGAVKK